jgi:hypothetical protein
MLEAARAAQPLPIVQGCILLLSSCPHCRGGPPQVTCERCHTDMLVLGAICYRILSAPDESAEPEPRL